MVTRRRKFPVQPIDTAGVDSAEPCLGRRCRGFRVAYCGNVLLAAVTLVFEKLFLVRLP